jgi:putative transport protein
MQWFVESFMHYPELAIFLSLALGYWVGRLKIGGFTVGAPLGTLLMGMLVGQMGIPITGPVKALFFTMFLFITGYKIGPQFFQSLKSDGLPQAAFAVVVRALCFACPLLAALFLGYDAGTAAGFMAGSQTNSVTLGVAGDAISNLSLEAAAKQQMLSANAIAYAITYIFGTAGTIWILSSVAPKMLGMNLAQACKELEAKMGGGSVVPGMDAGSPSFGMRAYQIISPELDNLSVGDLEARVVERKNARGFIRRLRRADEILECSPDTILHLGDIIAIDASVSLHAAADQSNLREVADLRLLDIPIEIVDVVITSKAAAGLTLKEMGSLPFSRGIFLRKLVRDQTLMPFFPETKVNRGDVLTITGSKPDVERAAQFLGYADRPTDMTDMIFVGGGITVGGLFGLITVKIGGIPLSLSSTAGALIAGLVIGWLRSVRPAFGRVPAPAVWVMDALGLNVFLAVVGITSGPSFITGIKSMGVSLMLAGVAATVVPLFLGLIIGKYVFKFHPAVLLGCLCGARGSAPALPSIIDAAQSQLPALYYPLGLAISQILAAVAGVLVVAFLAK